MSNVSGPTGPRPLTGTGTVTHTTPAAPTAPATPTAPTQPTGWAAGTGSRGTVDGSVAPPPPAISDVVASLPNPVRGAITTNIDRFQSRLESTLGHDAMSMARGRQPFRNGDTLSDAQMSELKDAAQDFIKDMPLGALSPEIASSVARRLADAGIETRDIHSTRLGDLGRIGADIAKDLVKDLKADSPAAFYGLAAGAAVAAGYAAYSGGSERLQRLGIRPQIKTSFFDDKLEVKLRGDWQAHFKDFKATGTVAYNQQLNDNWRLSGHVSADRSGLVDAGLTARYSSTTTEGIAYVNANRSGLLNAGAAFTYSPNENFRLSGGIDHNFQTNRTTANAEAAWRVRDNVDFALSASHDSQGDSRVGAGLRIRW